MEEQWIESKKALDDNHKWRKVHKIAEWYDEESEDAIIAQCGEYSHEGWTKIEGLLGPVHDKCQKCFSEEYKR